MIVPMKLSRPSIAPKRATEGAAALDLCLDLGAGDSTLTVMAGETVRASTGVALALPVGTCALVLGRSGLSRSNVTCITGLIDSDYRGEIQVLLHNYGKGAVTFDNGARIAQLLILELPHVVLAEVDTLDPTARGEGGFGSTGA